MVANTTWAALKVEGPVGRERYSRQSVHIGGTQRLGWFLTVE